MSKIKTIDPFLLALAKEIVEYMGKSRNWNSPVINYYVCPEKGHVSCVMKIGDVRTEAKSKCNFKKGDVFDEQFGKDLAFFKVYNMNKYVLSAMLYKQIDIHNEHLVSLARRARRLNDTLVLKCNMAARAESLARSLYLLPDYVPSVDPESVEV